MVRRHAEALRPINAASPRAAGGQEMIPTLHEDVLSDGIAKSLTKLCARFRVPRRTISLPRPHRRSIRASPTRSRR